VISRAASTRFVLGAIQTSSCGWLDGLTPLGYSGLDDSSLAGNGNSTEDDCKQGYLSTLAVSVTVLRRDATVAYYWLGSTLKADALRRHAVRH
jgi:hypothetical protein